MADLNSQGDYIDISQHLNDSANISSTSSSSSSSSPSLSFILYHDRPEWSDIKPLPQNDGPDPIVVIAYSEKFRDTFDYFRAMLAKDEHSERAIELTTDCVSLNPSNYTVWYYRRNVLQTLDKDLFAELQYIDDVSRENPKNYQIWYHRKCIDEWIKKKILDIKDQEAGTQVGEELRKNNSRFYSQWSIAEFATREKQFIAYILKQDCKNYHAWQHLQWLISELSAWEGELEFTETLIDDDVRNNSAWNHRHYVISNTTGFIDSVREKEINFTCHKIRLAPNNESSWNYLRGVLATYGLNKSKTVKKMCEDLYAKPGLKSPHLLGFLIDCIEETLSGQEQPSKSMLNRAISLCEELATKCDTIRVEYWNFISRELVDNFGDKAA